MKRNPLVEIISIGTELLIGQVRNTNAAWMGEKLNMAGFEVSRVTVVSDVIAHILQALKDAETRADVVLITGGLGPTKDDMTKEVLCDFFGSKLILHDESLKNVERIFKYFGRELTEAGRKQAEIPDKAKPILNQNGTAPGLWFEKDQKVFMVMPGVPLEMKAMMIDDVIPELNKKFTHGVIYHKTVHTHGIGESALNELIEDWENDLPDKISLAFLPQPGIVRLRLTARGDDKEYLKTLVNEWVKKLHAIIPELIFGYDGDRMEEITGRLLKEKGKTISTAESCTGGYLAHLLTSIPGSSAYFHGSVVAYANEVKEQMLGVSHQSLSDKGAVSEKVVKEMAAGAQKRFDTNYALSTSGIAGPDGGTPDKPVGTVWIALATGEKVIAKKFLFGGIRERNIRRAALWALNLLRLELMGFKNRIG